MGQRPEPRRERGMCLLFFCLDGHLSSLLFLGLVRVVGISLLWDYLRIYCKVDFHYQVDITIFIAFSHGNSEYLEP